jgi:serine/threonine protein kinase
MIVETAQQGHIMNEKKVIAQLKHPFLVRLHQTYKDKDRLYFLFEPVLGGELFTILRAQTLFDEPTAMFYAACVLCAFEHMHEFDIVYRDLKPENLLVDNKGYIKITDFGFAKHIGSSRTFTLCGTPDYLAPEIVAGKGHGKGVDWWTLGILIYEMLASYPPFYQEDPMHTYGKILQSEPSYPSYFSKASISILKKLLNKKASKRLGVVKGGAKLIKKQSWFETLDFDKLVLKEVKAPLIPKIDNDFDLTNFEDVANEEPDVCEPYEDDGSNWDAEF